MEYLTIENIGMAASIVISVAWALANAIDKFTDVHPDDDLDEFVGTLRKYTAKARCILEKFGFNAKMGQK